MNILTDNLLKELFYIQNRKMCLSETILYQYFDFFALLGTAAPLKTFYISLHTTKNLKKYKPSLTF